jgi:hypothetical protein
VKGYQSAASSLTATLVRLKTNQDQASGLSISALGLGGGRLPLLIAEGRQYLRRELYP